MIAEMFRDRDWDSDDAPNVKLFIAEVADQDSWSAAASPQDAVRPVQLEHIGRSIKPEQLHDLRAFMEQVLLQALFWGLSNPDRFEAWYDSTLTHHESMVPTMRGTGLDVEVLPPLPELLANSEQIVRDYESEIGPLPSIPPRLLESMSRSS